MGVEAGEKQLYMAVIMQNLRNYSKRLDTQSTPATLQQFLTTMTKDDNFQSQQRCVLLTDLWRSVCSFPLCRGLWLSL
jgi:hypothetical protein